jgi:hypothetical protein
MMNSPAPLSSCRACLTVDIDELRLISGVRVLCTVRVASSTFMYEEHNVIGGQTHQGMPVGIPENALGESVSLKPSSMIDPFAMGV